LNFKSEATQVFSKSYIFIDTSSYLSPSSPPSNTTDSMKKLCLTLFVNVFVVLAYSQSTGILVQRCLGDAWDSRLNTVKKTADGGYILAGMVNSNSGDVHGFIITAPSPQSWIVRLNSRFDTVWTKCISKYSTTNVLRRVSEFQDVIQTSDGGFVVTGTAQVFRPVSNGSEITEDFYITKLSSDGSEIWSSYYGGRGDDIPRQIIPTPDGGFLCLGTTNSSDGDVSGFHTNPNEFPQPVDVWLVKLSATGQLQWQKTYGTINIDYANKIIPTSDGNYIFVAMSGGLLNRQNRHDVWVVKIDPNGNILWDKTFGGTEREWYPTIEAVPAGGFLVACETYSTDDIGTGNHGFGDIAIFKITDDGNLVWSRTYGGSSDEPPSWLSPHSLSATPDGGFVYVASTISTDGDLTGVSRGSDELDPWVFKIDASGNILWQKCMGGSMRDRGVAVFPDHLPNNYIVLSTAESHDGDVFKNKAHSFMGTTGWFVRLGPTNTIQGSVFKDFNGNGTRDGGEPLVSNALITSTKPGHEKSTYSQNGRFVNEVDTGAYITTVTYSPYYTSVPSSIATPYRPGFFKSDTIHFALQPIPGIHDFSAFGFPLGPARPGFSVTYRLMVKNPGTENINSGTLKFARDPRLTYISSVPTLSSVSGDTLRWNFNGLNVGDSFVVNVNMRVVTPPLVSLGDTLKSLVMVPLPGDQNPSDDTALIKQLVTGSYDPNDKTEINSGKVSTDFITTGEYLQYMIRFQNTGTDTAFNITVRDTLDPRLEWSTLQMVSASHAYKVAIENGSRLAWSFPNINLVDSNRNEPLSHGYIVYRIRAKNTVTVNDVIHNTASIYFDYNFPVLTNDATTIVQDAFSVLPVQLVRFTGYLSDKIVTLRWSIADATGFGHFEVERSLDGRLFASRDHVAYTGGEHYNINDDIANISSKVIYYRLKMVDKDGGYRYSGIVAFQLAHKELFHVYPNPVTAEVYISYHSRDTKNLNIQVVDANGRVLISKWEKSGMGQNNLRIAEVAALLPGVYFVRVAINGGIIHSTSFIKAD
jgi:uncharacterized repeat protein (TIGR01451 family)